VGVWSSWTWPAAVRFSSDLAQKHFETFFPEEKPFTHGLPLTVEKWVRREFAAFATNELAIRRPQPLVVRHCNRSLHIRLAGTKEKTGHFLLLRVEDPTLELEKLSYFELGPRATGVLYWLAKGKTNEEIGIILGIATATVKVHLKNIYCRLNIENRATAASIVSEFLVRA
jgi:DNA-binding CsgD family transcriptional regulator